MITLTVVAFNGSKADGTLQASFDELGGSIGRSDANQLVLPDPERTISRVAAQVVFRNGAYAIVDRGSNPISVNGRALGGGRESPLAPGDRVCIGGYELSVQPGAAKAAAAAADDPFAGLLGPATAAAPSGGRLVDPLDLDPVVTPPKPAARASAGSAPPAAGIPSDWDPFASDAPDPNPRAAAPARDALGLDLGAAAAAPLVDDPGLRAAEPSTLDRLFGLSTGSERDPLADSVLDAPMAMPNTAADDDPLRALGMAPKATATSQSDAVSDLHRPFIPPTTIKPAAGPRPAPPVAGAVLSWDIDSNPSPTVIRARPAAGAPEPPTRPARTADEPAPAGSPPPPAASAAARPPAAPTPLEPAPQPVARAAAAPGGADATGLLEGLRRGLRVPAAELPALTPELMETIGALLREAARGTVDLLTVRATFKRELRAQATTIVPRDNNPLKFSPSAEVALRHLLEPPARGFMPAVPAMRDAYDDLRAHQFGFVAGMQAALEGVLERFDPALLEGRLTEKSLLHSMLPASRRARLWEVFTEHYARIRAEAGDDFHTLFGKAFLKAYEEQIDRLQAGPPDEPS